MTAKKNVTVFEISEAIAQSLQNTIPPARLRKLTGEQSQAILDAVSACAAKVAGTLQEASQ